MTFRQIGVFVFFLPPIRHGDPETCKTWFSEDNKIETEQIFFEFLLFGPVGLRCTKTPQLPKVDVYSCEMSVIKYECVNRNGQKSCLHETVKEHLKSLVNQFSFFCQNKRNPIGLLRADEGLDVHFGNPYPQIAFLGCTIERRVLAFSVHSSSKESVNTHMEQSLSCQRHDQFWAQISSLQVSLTFSPTPHPVCPSNIQCQPPWTAGESSVQDRGSTF